MEKNIFLLPTKESHLFYHDCIKNYSYKIDKYNKCKETKCKHPQNIYITNDEKVEIGEYGLGYAHGIKNGVGSGWFLFKHDGSNQAKLNALCTDTKKIIITNDSELITDGVQEISEDFLQWFIKNPSCESVEVKEKQHFEADKSKRIDSLNGVYYSYKIIIPKEAKQEATLKNLENISSKNIDYEFVEIVNDNFWDLIDSNERLKEAAEKFYSEQSESYENAIEPTFDDSRYLVTGFIDGVKSNIARDYWFEKFQAYVEETKQETIEEPDKWSLDNAKEFALNYFKKSDEVPSKGMFTYELLLRILEAGIECGYKFGTKASAKYSEEDMFEFSQWVSNEDWVYLPSKKYWVNEEQEELDQKLSSKEILDLWFEQYKKNTL
jgi:hypothetical protein